MKKLSKQTALCLVILGVGIVFIVLGLLQGDFADVLRKAILICFECIGIG